MSWKRDDSVFRQLQEEVAQRALWEVASWQRWKKHRKSALWGSMLFISYWNACM